MNIKQALAARRSFFGALSFLGAALPAAAHAAPPVAAADFDGDGRADLAFHRPDGSWATVPMLRSTGDGWLASNSAAPAWANQKGAVAIAGDFNGDKRTDLAFHLPGSGAAALPVLLSAGNGNWTAVSFAAPSWANQAGVIAVAGDFNGDKRTDLAFHLPGGSWTTVPTLLARGDGGWTAAVPSVPSWANQPGVIALAGDYDGNGRTDLAFQRPGVGWSSVPVLLANGSGGWSSTNFVAPAWANESGVVALVGDYDGNGRSDLAFHRPGSGWASVPMLRANGDGSWTASNYVAPSFANQPGAVAMAGDYDGNGRSDLAFYRPDGVWTTLPILFSSGNGAWTSTNGAAPAYANRPGVFVAAGDYNGDGRADLAFHRPDGEQTSVPILYAASGGTGGWSGKAYAAPSWATQLHARAIAITRGELHVLHPIGDADGGDAEYDQDAEEEEEWADEAQAWLNFLRLFVRLVLGYDEYVRQSGLNGDYDGYVENGGSRAAAFLSLEHASGQVHGKLIIKEATVRLDGGVCSDVVVPVGALPVNAASSGLYAAAGTTSRSVTVLGVISGTVDISFNLALETTSYRTLDGSLFLDVPWPCANQSLTFHFTRRPLL